MNIGNKIKINHLKQEKENIPRSSSAKQTKQTYPWTPLHHTQEKEANS